MDDGITAQDKIFEGTPRHTSKWVVNYLRMDNLIVIDNKMGGLIIIDDKLDKMVVWNSRPFTKFNNTSK